MKRHTQPTSQPIETKLYSHFDNLRRTAVFFKDIQEKKEEADYYDLRALTAKTGLTLTKTVYVCASNK